MADIVCAFYLKNRANHILQDIIRDEKSAEQKQELKKVLEEHKLEQEPEFLRIGGKLTYVLIIYLSVQVALIGAFINI